ncbi:hypothetical protein SAMN04489860_1463 [Paraoerskovia marina]|uniref:Uncharacterized protein n=1 Tax=Paraoerskovia marina TaxID=545619 RepID=A0A1H1RW93_9CELL|nr:hypothetical protein [Paraoerskovia marina]SDS39945.1 hypothetical protein SAMN04489860_1463 [Paraoerskovia marina]
MTEPSTTRPTTPFSDIPVADYVRDAVGALLLLMSLSLPWDEGHRAADHVGVVLSTLLAFVVLAVPYAARLGIMPAGWTVRSTRTTRLVAAVPYAVMVALAVVADLTTAGPGPGLGTAAALGMAGVALTAQPRACELGPEGEDPAGPRWTRALGIVGIVGLAIAVVGVVVVAVDGPGVWVLLAAVVVAAWLVLLLGWPVLGSVRGQESARVTTVGVGIAVVAAAVLGSGSNTLPHLTTFSAPTPVILLVPVAGAIAASAAVMRRTVEVSALDRWVGTAVRGLALLVATAGAVVLWAAFGLASGVTTVVTVVTLVLGLLVLAGAILGWRSLSADAVQGRRSALAGAGLAVLAGTVLMIVDVSPTTTTGTAEFMLALGLPALVIVALTVPREVRDHFRDNRPSSSTDAYEWKSTRAASEDGFPDAESASTRPADEPAGSSPEPVRRAGNRDRAVQDEPRITPVEPVRSGYAARPGLAEQHTEVLSVTSGREPETFAGGGRGAHETQVMAPATGFSAAEAGDPSTPLETLARIAAESPDLRPVIAENPSTYPALLDWLDRLGDPAVDAALARRAGRS